MFCMPVIFMIKITFVIFIADLSFSFILFLEHKSMCITLSLSSALRTSDLSVDHQPCYHTLEGWHLRDWGE